MSEESQKPKAKDKPKIDPDAVLEKMSEQHINAETIKGILCNHMVTKKGQTGLSMRVLSGSAELDKSTHVFRLKIEDPTPDEKLEVVRNFKRIAKGSKYIIDFVA